MFLDENPANIPSELGDIRVKEEQVHEDDSAGLFLDNFPSPSGDDDRPHKEEVHSDPDYSFCILPDLSVPVSVRGPKKKKQPRPPPIRYIDLYYSLYIHFINFQDFSYILFHCTSLQPIKNQKVYTGSSRERRISTLPSSFHASR